MNEAARILIGSHDFHNFGKPHKIGGPTKRCVFHSDWRRHADDLVYEVEANAFLYHMVRRTVKLLVSVGHNRLNIEFIRKILALEEDPGPQGIAPPNGLILEEVVY
jgi:tRNA pseudouridine38-40 synthase